MAVVVTESASLSAGHQQVLRGGFLVSALPPPRGLCPPLLPSLAAPFSHPDWSFSSIGQAAAQPTSLVLSSYAAHPGVDRVGHDLTAG